jgi:hypothetical protein
MNFKYKVLENFIPETYQNILLEMYDTSVAQWAYLPNLSGLELHEQDTNNKNIVPSFGFTQKVFQNNIGATNSNWSFTAPLLWFLEHTTGVKITDIDRVRANLMVPNGNKNSDTYNEPHIDDHRVDSLTMIYYLNDSDGDTRIFDKTVSEGFLDLKMIHSQRHKKGEAIIFPSNRFHSSSSPIKSDRRMNLNFVLNVENLNEM